MKNADLNLVLEFITKNKLNLSVESRMFDIGSELGELNKEILKTTDYGKKKFEISDSFLDELGDVYFSLLSLFLENNIDSSLVLKKTLNKYNERITKKGTLGS